MKLQYRSNDPLNGFTAETTIPVTQPVHEIKETRQRDSMTRWSKDNSVGRDESREIRLVRARIAPLRYRLKKAPTCVHGECTSAEVEVGEHREDDGVLHVRAVAGACW